MTPSSVGQALAQNSMTISGSYLAIGSVSWVHCLLATSAWNSMYSLSLSWTRLSLRKDQSLIALKRHWCSLLQKWCPSNSISACRAALDPSPAMAFLALLARSFFRAIAYKGTSIKKLISMKYVTITLVILRIETKKSINFVWFWLIACVIVQLIKQITTQCVLFWKKEFDILQQFRCNVPTIAQQV